MKLSMSERRKLNNRLPLWESSYKSGNATERKELIVKIEDARKKLGMPMFLKENKIEVIKNVEKNYQKTKFKLVDIENKETYFLGNRLVKKEEIPIITKIICDFHNNYKIMDCEIAKILGRTSFWICKFVEKNINKKYEVVNYENKINFEKYVEMKNNKKTELEICKEFNCNLYTLSVWENENIRKVYYLDESYKKYMGKSAIFFEKAIVRLNNGESLSKIYEGLNITLSNIYNFKRKYLKIDYIYDECKKLNPYNYIEMKNKGMLDSEISKIFSISQSSITYMKNKYIVLKYFPKTENNV